MKLRLLLTLTAGILIVLGIVIARQVMRDTPVTSAAQEGDSLPYVPEFQTAGLRIMVVDDGRQQGNQVVTYERLAQTFDTLLADSLAEAMAVTDSTPVDAIVLVGSPDLVSPSWVSQKYNEGITIVGIGISGIQMGELIRDNCITDGFANYPPGSSFFVMASRTVSGTPEDVARILESYNRSCGEQGAEGVAGASSYSARYTAELFTDERSYQVFSYLLADHMAGS